MVDDAVRIDEADGDDEGVTAYLASSPESTVFYLPEWHRIVTESYGHRCRYLVARRGDAVVGVFPLTAVRHPLLGTKMIAMPYQMHSGVPLGESDEVRAKLAARGLGIARDAGAKYMEVRHYDAAPYLEDLGFLELETQLVCTESPLENLSKKKIRKGHREEVTRAEKRGGVTIEESDSEEDLRTFRRMFLAHAQSLGAPQAGWVFFDGMRRHLGDRIRLLVARQEDRFIGGVMTLDDGGTIFVRYGAYSSPEAVEVRLGKALFWRIMSDGKARGCTRMNSGISFIGNTGLVRWKEGWNGTSRPVRMFVHPLKGSAPDPGAYFEGFGLAKKVWKRLPLPLADWLGHRVTRWIG